MTQPLPVERKTSSPQNDRLVPRGSLPANDRRERPILFSGPMVRALLNGSKTQTRRIIKGSPLEVVQFIGRDDRPTGDYGLCHKHPRVIDAHRVCPYGVPGDALWVKETWRMPDAFDPDSPTAAKSRVDPTRSPNVFYEADGAIRAAGAYTGHPGKTRVSIHMPRWASRITLRVTDVRVARLNEISEADAQAEGMTRAPGGWWSGYDGAAAPGPISAYAMLWEHINGAGSWDLNPWVWAVSFQRVSEPTDAPSGVISGPAKEAILLSPLESTR